MVSTLFTPVVGHLHPPINVAEVATPFLTTLLWRSYIVLQVGGLPRTGKSKKRNHLTRSTMKRRLKKKTKRPSKGFAWPF